MTSPATTLLDELLMRIRMCDSGGDGKERPVAILWTDPESEWQPLLEVAHSRAEELIVLGDYSPKARRGPAPWIRCVVDRTLPEPAIPPDRIPIVYMPGVGRQDLRAGEDCPARLQPLVELMFRGTLWLQQNGSDWTVSAFLTSPRTLGLDIAGDHATSEALHRALRELALVPISQLSGRRFEADDFDRLLTGDVVRDLLRWMGDPRNAEQRMGRERWAAFVNQCKARFGLDPVRAGVITAAERMAEGEGVWAEVWQRFEEAPAAYEGILDPLLRAQPAMPLLADPLRWPHVSDKGEEDIRTALDKLDALPHPKACQLVLELEKSHAARRRSVWAKIGRTPMANALGPLARLAETVRTSLGGGTPDEMASRYMERGWIADAAAWEAMAGASPSDETVVARAVKTLLEPWLEETARTFQAAIDRRPLPGLGGQPMVEASSGGCVLFADGLRFDLGQRLTQRLEGRGCRVTRRHRWAALPTVTATAKTAVTPVTKEITAQELDPTFAPRLRASGKPVQAPLLREAIQASGYQILDPSDLGLPLKEGARGWIECGQIDERGHQLGAQLARQLSDELDRLVEKITGLLNAGWKSVRVVTDHGWLFLPGGLPKVDLPKHLAETRWKRCAIITGKPSAGLCLVPWHWHPTDYIATGPGIACFNNSPEYAHGGVSLQECLVPDLLVEKGGDRKALPAIRSVKWRRMRCMVECSDSTSGVRADVRVSQPGGKSILSAPKPVESDGAVSIVIEDDYETADLVLVLLDSEGTVLAQRSIRVGADS